MLITKDNKRYFEVPDQIYTDGKKYELGDSLGSGGNSSVLECFDNQGNPFAIKFQLNLSEKSRKRFEQEIKVHSRIKHPHLINYVTSGEVDAEEQVRKGTKKCNIPFLIMEKADRNLYEYIQEQSPKGVPYSEYIQQFIGLSDALAQLHKFAIHRDLKLENILVLGDRWVIGDFGLCSFLDEDHEDLTGLNEKIGPKYWMSPEAINRIYNETEEIVPASDVFQMSAIFWFVVTARYPLGIVTKGDWNKGDEEICDILIEGLMHNSKSRIQNGEILHEKIEDVVRTYRGVSS